MADGEIEGVRGNEGGREGAFHSSPLYVWHRYHACCVLCPAAAMLMILLILMILLLLGVCAKKVSAWRVRLDSLAPPPAADRCLPLPREEEEKEEEG